LVAARVLGFTRVLCVRGCLPRLFTLRSAVAFRYVPRLVLVLRLRFTTVFVAVAHVGSHVPHYYGSRFVAFTRFALRTHARILVYAFRGLRFLVLGSAGWVYGLRLLHTRAHITGFKVLPRFERALPARHLVLDSAVVLVTHIVPRALR